MAKLINCIPLAKLIYYNITLFCYNQKLCRVNVYEIDDWRKNVLKLLSLQAKNSLKGCVHSQELKWVHYDQGDDPTNQF
jgi:hypothetical protein